MTRLLCFSFAILICFPGCNNESYYAESEQALKTSGYYGLLDHIAAYYPRGIGLNFAGYIVGIEEAPRSLVAADTSSIVVDESVYESGNTVRRLVRSIRYTTQFISHIIHYEGRPFGEDNCVLYSLYNNHGASVLNPCEGVPNDILAQDYDYRSAFDRSWYAMDILRSRLQKDMSEHQYSHIIIAVMGLDTAQEEAIRNYRSIISSIRVNAGDDFNPLFIGITWPSFYANRWFDPIWEVMSYLPVADRADVMGLTWLGVLLNNVIIPFSEKANVSIIGHSFGARAASMALCVGPAIRPLDGSDLQQGAKGAIDNFIGLAPAFSMARFNHVDRLFYENVHYKDYCPVIRRFVFTSSQEDNAFDVILWGDPVGKYQVMEDYCKHPHQVSVSCTSTDNEGYIHNYDPAAKISYIDTSLIMQYNMPGTDGRGHSDIYRNQVGQMLWELLKGDRR